MKKTVIIGIAAILLLVGIGLFIRSRMGSGEQGMGSLIITSTPQAKIFLNDQSLTTPYEGTHPAGDYTLKLIPESTIEQAVSWEGQIKLRPNLVTYVNRELGSSDLTSAGEMLTLEKTTSKKAELVILSTPDNASVTLAGQEKDTTPLVLKDIEPGDYELGISAPGYKSRSVKIKLTPGHKLTAEFQLAQSGEVLPSPSPEPSPSLTASPKSSPKTSATPKATPKTSPSASASASASIKPRVSPPPKPYVEILDTPVGFLRVRKEPSTSSEEVGRVNPGEFYSLLDEESGWYKIEYASNKEGWISSQYAKKFE